MSSSNLEKMPVNLIHPEFESPSQTIQKTIKDPTHHAEEWIPRNIKKRVCCRYVQKADEGRQDICECGHERCVHSAIAQHYTGSSKWNMKTDTKQEVTDAYGQIQFPGVGQRIGQYVRVDHETDMDMTLKLLKDCWNVDAPNLLISVTGGAKNFKMLPRLKEMFRRGLINVAKSTGAWIITGGMHAGVMKQVGDAVHDHLVAHGSKAGIVAIGIATWGCVKGKEVLVKKGGSWPAEYKDDADMKQRRQSPLDPNHSHFILVDNGTQYVFGGEIDFRAKLEAHISQKYRESDADKIPTVCVVLQGGPGTLLTVHSAIMAGTPVVIVEGSGGAADILANAYAKSENANEGKIWETVADQISKEFQIDETASHKKQAQDENADKKSYVTLVKECLMKRDHMTVFRMDSSGSATEIDLVILQALLKVNREMGCGKQLKLALTWNRIDIAKSDILTEDAKWQPSELEELMEYAILHNRVDFVKLFLENGISFQTFLTDERILMFYEKTSQMDKFLKDREKNKCTEADVHQMLARHIGDSVTEQWGKSGGSDRLLLLFLWAILQNNIDLARLFWEEGKEGIAAALLAQRLLKKMAEHVDDPALLTNILGHMAFFEGLAVGVLTECYVEDERKAQLLLTRDLPSFGHKTILKLAAEADNKLLLANIACQSLLNRIWKGKMALNNSRWRLVTSLLLPPFLFCLIKFRDDAWNEIGSKPSRQNTSDGEKNVDGRQSKQNEAGSLAYLRRSEPKEAQGMWCQKLTAFFFAPIVIFAGNCVSYVIFLCLFSIILLTDFHEGITKKEYLLIFWVGTLILEEVRQMMKRGVCRYIKDMWNILDMATMMIFITGFVLRWMPVATCGKCLNYARVILAIDVMFFYLRALHLFSVHRKLGPKLVMIHKMIIDMFYFIVILMVFVTAYGVALQAILYPNSKLGFSLISNVFKKAYFQIYGELFLDELDGTLACETTPTSNSSLPRCPVNTAFVPSTLMAVYILFTNVLMLNLLIAMFSYTFNQIQANTDEHWFFQRYFLIKEYHDRPPLAPPIIVLYHSYLLLRRFMCCSKDSNSDFQMTYNDSLTKELILWENMNADEYVRQTHANKQHSLENRVKETQERVDLITRKLEQLAEMISSSNH